MTQKSQASKRILIIKPSALGDIVMALPAVCCLSKSFADAKIDFFVRPEFAPLIVNHSCIDDLVIFERKKLGSWWYRWSAFVELIRLIKKLRRNKYDIVIDMQGRFRSAIFGWFSGSRVRIGPAGTQELTRPFYTQTVKQTESNIHQVDYYIEMATLAGAMQQNVGFKLESDSESDSQIFSLLAEHNVDKANYAVFVPSATVEQKKWPIENFAVLAGKLYEKYKCNIVVVGSAAENQTAEKLIELADVPVVNFAGKTNISQLVSLLQGSKFVVSNDTGPGHIASAVGAATVIVFGYTNPLRVGPYKRPDAAAAVCPDKRGTAVESTDLEYDIKNVTPQSVFDIISRAVDDIVI